MMVLFQATWRVTSADRELVLGSLRRLVEPTRALGGCMLCRVCTDIEDPDKITYLEEWTDRPSLDAHLREDSMKVLLSAVDLACSRPAIHIQTICEDQGIEAIALARGFPAVAEKSDQEIQQVPEVGGKPKEKA